MDICNPAKTTVTCCNLHKPKYNKTGYTGNFKKITILQTKQTPYNKENSGFHLIQHKILKHFIT